MYPQKAYKFVFAVNNDPHLLSACSDAIDNCDTCNSAMNCTECDSSSCRTTDGSACLSGMYLNCHLIRKKKNYIEVGVWTVDTLGIHVFI